MKPIRLFSMSVIFLVLFTACGAVATQVPVTEHPATEVPVASEAPIETEEPIITGTPDVPPTSQALSLEEQMGQIDSALKETLGASIVYNRPDSMILDQTVTIELLLNPSLSPQVLSTQVSEPGQVVSSSIQITPRMKALLIADDDTALSIKPIHDNAEQIISKADTTRWAWLVSARKGGAQQLTLIIYRLVEYEGRDYWREVETYKADINIEVTFIQRVKSLDWGWLVGVFVTAIAIPAIWRWVDQRKKQVDQKTPPQS